MPPLCCAHLVSRTGKELVILHFVNSKIFVWSEIIISFWHGVCVGILELIVSIPVPSIPPHRMLQPGPEVIKLFSCSTQLSMKFQSLISTEMVKIN